VASRIRFAVAAGLLVFAAWVGFDLNAPVTSEAAGPRATVAERSCRPDARSVGHRLRTRAARLRRVARRQARLARRHLRLDHPVRARRHRREARRQAGGARVLLRTAQACLRRARGQHALAHGVAASQSPATTSATSGSGSFRVGLVTSYAENLGEVDWVTDVGARIMRHEFEDAPDAWDDSFYRRTARLGITVVPLINTTTVPATEAARRAFVEKFKAHVVRYGPGGSFWRENPDLSAAHAPRVFEVMNEPYVYWLGGPYDPAGYAQLVKRTAEAVRPVNSEVKLALAAATTYFGPENNGADWIGALYAAVPNLNDYFDVVAVHPYAHDPDTCDPQFRWCFRQVEVIRSRFVARGAADKRIWITELGNNTRGDGAHSEAEQAAYLTRYVEMAKSYGYVDGLLYYTYRDFCTDGGDKECWFGVVRPDGSRKPAFDSLRRAAQANP
jgi:Glycosyl hydrolase catalytic core